ncbi:MBL fold metallo-hydrolase [Salisediminibacterium beveridgei]|uniref:Late competence protein ComEC, DNA transport n=1 Tax=Salisediminibacterium beveridgei TaxID=632773 RepID=A0A1D7QU62_9BACI|nr:MBL fold metallo-hydrolase [Salisediminibacterium beveridgei]AOM82527.1 Late competence protein ComEC, DNA transport [Salisediminibacterium beveridgei]
MKQVITALTVIFTLSACGTEDPPQSNETASDPAENKAEQNTNTQNDEPDNGVPSDENHTNDQNEDSSAAGDSASGTLEVHFIDAGQADATLFLHEEGDDQFSILYDTGDWRQTDVVSYLHDEDLEGIDILIGSHPHADHIGQMDIILNEFDVSEVWMSGDDHTSATYERVLDAIENTDAVYDEPRAGDAFEVGDLVIDIIHPETLTGDLHEGSLSMRLSFGEHSFVLTGDAEIESEQEIIDRYPELSSTVLHLGHHGSHTSTSEDFLNAVAPEFAIISAGADNSFGHPHSEVVDRIQKHNMKTYGTYVHGTILVYSDGEMLEIETEQTGEITPGTREDSSDPEGDDSGSSVTVPDGDCVDINSASHEELQAIMHIGEGRAGDLIEQRPYDQVNQLTRIHGIGEGRIRDIQDEGIACVEEE